jgi:hypothetical protein
MSRTPVTPTNRTPSTALGPSPTTVHPSQPHRQNAQTLYCPLVPSSSSSPVPCPLFSVPCSVPCPLSPVPSSPVPSSLVPSVPSFPVPCPLSPRSLVPLSPLSPASRPLLPVPCFPSPTFPATAPPAPLCPNNPPGSVVGTNPQTSIHTRCTRPVDPAIESTARSVHLAANATAPTASSSPPLSVSASPAASPAPLEFPSAESRFSAPP